MDTTPAIARVAARLAKVQGRKTSEVFARQVEREAIELDCEPETLRMAIREQQSLLAGRRLRESQAASKKEQRLAADWETAVERIEAAGWKLTYISLSGSRYYLRAGETLRLSDHVVPASSERDLAAEQRGFQPQYDHEAIVGERGWLRHLEDLCCCRLTLRGAKWPTPAR